MAWIKSEDLDDILPAIDDDGNTIGYIRSKSARQLGIPIITIEKPKRYLKDPYVVYHASLLKERGLLSRGQDLNEVQTVLLLGEMIRQREGEMSSRKNSFEEMLFANNPELYKQYKDQEQKELIKNDPRYQQMRPQSLEDLMAMFASFDEEANLTRDKEEGEGEPEGWLDAILAREDINKMQD